MNVINETATNTKTTGTLECCEKLLKRAAVVIGGVLGVLLTYKFFEAVFTLVASVLG